MDVKSKIYTIRNLQVMLDSDLAELYGVELKRLNEQVKRNIGRFPDKFMFQLTAEEYDFLRSQIATINTDILKSQIATSNNKSLRFRNSTLNANILKSQIVTSSSRNLKYQNGTSSWGGKRKLPFVFTEQGVAMLSGILKSKTAIKISIQIMDAFVAMRKFITENAGIFQRVDNTERKLIEHDQKFEQVFSAIESKNILPEKGIFFDGQIFDAYKFVSDLVKSAKKSIILVDNYIDESVLTIFSKRGKGVEVVIYTKNISKQVSLDVEKYNSQYAPIEIKEFRQSHDRFMIIDNTQVYHLGASLKDVGKKWFAFSKLDKESVNIIGRLEKI